MISIFLVEDEAIVALDLRNILERIGYSVVGVVPSGEAALEKIKDLNPDLIIMDIKLQGSLDGIDTAAILNEKYNIPFIFLSAYSDEGIIERAKHVEPFGYIIKPFGANNLRASIEMAMYRAKMKGELSKLEQQLRQSEKMKAVGNLAGGIAHDFNNILTVILGYSTLIEEKITQNENVLSEVEGIRNAALKANSLTKHLLAFSRKQVLNPKVVEINIIVENVSRMITRLLPENISLSIITATEYQAVFIDQAQIEQVVLNMVLNAKDAMPEGGYLVISSSICRLDKNLLVTTGLVPKGNYVTIAVKDNGIGISQDNIEHIFDPFFTTKSVYKGTGLGLSSVYGIIKQSGGYIDVKSKPGKGTTFTIYMETTADKAFRIKKPEEKIEKLEGNETIFIVEDEDDVRKIVVRILSVNGYQTIEASNPGEAILISENKDISFNLLITDVFMPLMNGKQLSKRLHTMGKDFKTIYISGYESKMVKKKGINIKGDEFLPKPFESVELLTMVRHALDGMLDS